MKSQKTDFVILGLLSIKPMSGYEMRSIIQKSTCHFWSESNGQLYPALNRLVQNELITLQEAQGAGKKKHLYAISEKGRTALEQWLVETTDHKSTHRDEELLKLFFGKNNSVDTTIALLRTRESRLIHARREYLSIQKEISDLKSSPHHLYWTLSLNNGIALAEAEIRWCKDSIASLEELLP